MMAARSCSICLLLSSSIASTRELQIRGCDMIRRSHGDSQAHSPLIGDILNTSVDCGARLLVVLLDERRSDHLVDCRLRRKQIKLLLHELVLCQLPLQNTPVRDRLLAVYTYRFLAQSAIISTDPHLSAAPRTFCCRPSAFPSASHRPSFFFLLL